MNNTILEIRNLSHSYKLDRHTIIPALDQVSFQMKRGEIVGIVGESGSGKSTLARCVMNIEKPARGTIYYKGIDLFDRQQFKLHQKMIQRTRQMIFQDSATSLNQRMKVRDIITEPMRIHHMIPKRGTLQKEAAFQLKYVGLDDSYLNKYPPELSGGMRQRVAIARAVGMEPELLVADEPVASLDVSIQAQIINLFQHLQKEHGFSILFIAHDLAVVRYLCDRVGVMCRGKLVEMAATEELFQVPKHPYTQALLSSIPIPDPRLEKARKPILYDHAELEQDGCFVEVSPEHFVLLSKENPLCHKKR